MDRKSLLEKLQTVYALPPARQWEIVSDELEAIRADYEAQVTMLKYEIQLLRDASHQ